MKVYVRFYAIVLVFFGGKLLAVTPAANRTLTLEQYLESVKKANQTLQIASTTIAAGELRAASTDIIFSPQFFTQATHTADSKEASSPLNPEKIEATNLTFGVQKLWESGLQTQVSHSLTKVHLDQPGLAPTYNFNLPMQNPAVPGQTINVPVSIANPALSLLPRNDYTEAKTQIDLVQPLWKNANGLDYKLTRESAQTRIQMQKLGESYKVKALLAQAEYVYWQLALAEEAVRNQEGTIERFRKIRSWAAKRAQSQLGDRVDLLQADSGFRSKQFELEMTKKDRNALQRSFNTLRGQAGGSIGGKLQTLSTYTLDRMVYTKQEVKRLDIEIAKKAERLSQIEVEQSREKFKAQLDVFGSVALNALDGDMGQAMAGSLGNAHPTYVVGVKFTTPLDHDIINRDREGLIQTGTAMRLDREQKEFNARQDWADLQAQLVEAHARVRLAKELESAQKEKLAYERERLDTGRTTTYQILTFENDFAQSQLATIKAKADVLSVRAKLKSFGDAE